MESTLSNNNNNDNFEIQLNPYIQSLIFKDLFNDKTYHIRWRLSLNLVCKKWYSFMASQVSNYTVKIDFPSSNSTLKIYSDFQHILNRDYCIFSNAKTLHIKPTATFSLDLFLNQYVTYFEQICNMPHHENFILMYDYSIQAEILKKLIEVINNSNSNDNKKTIAFSGIFANAEDAFSPILDTIKVPIRFIPTFGLALDENFHMHSMHNSIKNRMLSESKLEVLDCFAATVLPEQLENTEGSKSLRKFIYTFFHSLSIDGELRFLSSCKNLTKVRFIKVEFRSHINDLLDFIAASPTLSSVEFDCWFFNDSTLVKILSNPGIRKLRIGKSTFDPNEDMNSLNITEEDEVHIEQFKKVGNTTLNKLTFQMPHNNQVFIADQYSLFFNPTAYFKRLRHLSLPFMKDHESWLTNLSASDPNVQNLHILSLSPCRYINADKIGVDIDIFSRLLTGNQTMKKISLHANFYRRISNLDSFLEAVDSSLIHTIEIFDRPKKVLPTVDKSIPNKTKYFVYYGMSTKDFQFVQYYVRNDKKEQPTSLFSKVASYFGY